MLKGVLKNEYCRHSSY